MPARRGSLLPTVVAVVLAACGPSPAVPATGSTAPTLSVVASPRSSTAPSSSAARTYMTDDFIPGLTVTLPGDGSLYMEEIPGELALHWRVTRVRGCTSGSTPRRMTPTISLPACRTRRRRCWPGWKRNADLVISDVTTDRIDDGIEAPSFGRQLVGKRAEGGPFVSSCVLLLPHGHRALRYGQRRASPYVSREHRCGNHSSRLARRPR